MKVKGNHPLAEVTAKCLFGIERVPAVEARKMVSQAARAAVAWHEEHKGDCPCSICTNQREATETA